MKKWQLSDSPAELMNELQAMINIGGTMTRQEVLYEFKRSYPETAALCIEPLWAKTMELAVRCDTRPLSFTPDEYWQPITAQGDNSDPLAVDQA